jgi:hypothetical protein
MLTFSASGKSDDGEAEPVGVRDCRGGGVRRLADERHARKTRRGASVDEAGSQIGGFAEHGNAGAARPPASPLAHAAGIREQRLNALGALDRKYVAAIDDGTASAAEGIDRR